MKKHKLSFTIGLTSCLFILLCAACGNDDDSKVVEVVQITPEPGKRISYREQFTVQFNTPIIPSSGSITFGNWTFTLPDSAVSDTITWNRCFTGMTGERVQLSIRDFQDVNGLTQAKAFQASYQGSYYDVDSRIQGKALQAPYSAFLLDPFPPEVIEYHPIGQDVDPESINAIRVVFDRPMVVSEFKIVPPIDGTALVNNDDIHCMAVFIWDFADAEQLRYATDYRIVLWGSDAAGNKVERELEFSTRAKP